MPISISDLPPKYQAQVLQKWQEQQSRRGVTAAAKTQQITETKYHNKPTERVLSNGDVIRFDSQKEARRYDYLIEQERTGEIRELRLQAEFTLQEAYTDTKGKRVRAIRYKADFTYYRPPDTMRPNSRASCRDSWSDGLFVVEDVKSKPTRTKEYVMKRKMLKDRFGYDITEV